MPEFDVDTERINVFPVGEEYYFKHYFDRTDIFEHLSEYYNDDKYRFEIPTEEFGEVRSYLEDQYFDPVLVDEVDQFCVVQEKYTEHADILRNSVANWERQGQRFFLMQDQLSVREAVERGATKLEETEFVLGI